MAAAAVEVIAIACLMNLCRGRLFTIMGGVPAVILTVEVEPEDFDFKGNFHGEV